MWHRSHRWLTLCLFLALVAPAASATAQVSVSALPAAPAAEESDPATQLPADTTETAGAPAPASLESDLFQPVQPYDPAVAQAAIAAVERSLSVAPEDEPDGINWKLKYLTTRWRHALAYDSARRVTIVFGGYYYSGDTHYVDDTWEWDGTNWVQSNPASHPPARHDHAMAYDSTRGVTVLFGGYTDSSYLGDTWEWDGTNWVQRSPVGHPSVRRGHSLAYDSARGVTVLFGGYDGSGNLDDTWEWDGTNWVQRTPASHPLARRGHTLVYDSARGVTVLFGGYDSSYLYLDDTWEWDGMNWVQRTPTSHPSARTDHAMAYDSARGVTVLFGGGDGSSYKNDTWEWNGTNWVQRSPTMNPTARYDHAMAYDSTRGVTVLFGGFNGSGTLDNTWEWDGTNWAQRDAASHPPARGHTALAYDSARGVTVLFGGYDGSGNLDDTWEWDGTNWVQRTPANHPSARARHALAYDSARGVTVLFGGYAGSYLDDTWEWDGTNWVQRTPTSHPSARTDHAMAYDSARGVTVLFGGYGGGYKNDTWEWNGTNWVQRTATTNPTDRYGHAMAYDSAREVTVLFGGFNGSSYKNDTWEWDGMNWVQRSPTTKPTARYDHAQAYDSARGVTVLFGGWISSSSDLCDTWEWDGASWVQRLPSTNPERRYAHALAYNSAHEVAVLFGGTGAFRDDTWEYGWPLPRPTLFPISNPGGDGAYLVSWSAVTGVLSYTLQEDDDNVFASPLVRYQGGDIQFQVAGQPGGLWFYRVRAENLEGESTWSNVESVGVVPAAPVLSPIDNPDGEGDYLVNWNDVAGATSYTLQEDDNASFSSPAVRYTGPDSQFTMTGQSSGTWYYRVRASNAVGDSPWSDTQSTIVIPAAPTLAPIANSDGDGDFVVDWSDEQGASSYTLEEDDNPDFSSPGVRYQGPISQYSVSGQYAGVWYYRAQASNAAGDSPWSNVEFTYVLPAAPALYAIDNAGGNSSYLVDWSSVQGSTGYTLEEDDNAGFASPTVRYQGSTSQYPVTGQEGGTWYYRARAYNGGGNGAWSDVESTTVKPEAPFLYPIANSDGNGDYTVDWTAPQGASSYTLQEDDNSSFTSPSTVYQGANSSFEITAQPVGTWYYRVQAGNAGGDSDWSNVEGTGVIPAAPVLGAISNPDGDGGYLVDWSEVTGATGYVLQEDDNTGFSSPTVRYTGAGSQYPVTGQQAGTWYYRVQATSPSGNSSWSNAESVSVIPAAPVLATIGNPDGDGEYTVDWNDVTGATGYVLQEDDNAGFSSPTERYNGANSQYDVAGQGAGTWYYRVRASNLGGDGPWSNTESASVLPAAPVLAAISNQDGDGEYTVDWNDVTGATGYTLQEDDNAGFSSPTERYSGADSQYDVIGQPGGTWYYRVKASNLGGDGPSSNVESVSVLPAAPLLAAISNPDGDDEYTVDWNDVTGATGYALQEDDNTGFSSPTEHYTGANSQYEVTGQQAGAWYYRVKASNLGGDSPWSNTELVSVIPAAPLLAPINNPDGDGDYLLDWNNPTGATTYTLQEDDNASFSSPTERYTGANSQYDVAGQQAGAWYYRVKASNGGGDSSWSNTELVSVAPAAPLLAPINNPDGDGHYLLDWSNVTSATAYTLQEDDNAGFSSPTERYAGADSQYQITTQQAGTWYYRVKASNLGGDSPWSNTEVVSVIPAAPVLAAISNPDSDGDYLVDWNDVTGATGYTLQEDDNAGFSSPTERNSGVNSQYQVTGQGAGTWYYRVKASNLGGDGPWSNTRSVGVDEPPIAAPALAPISNPEGDGSYLVDWSDVVAATGYTLEEDDSFAFVSPTVRYTGPASHYQVTGQPGGTWYYRVRASGAGGDGPWSNIESASVIPAAPVLAPISNPNGDGNYLVDWSDLPGASFTLQEDDHVGFASPVVRYTGTASQYQVNGQEGGTWYYRVRASNIAGDSPWSTVESASVLPAAPVLLPIDNADGNGSYRVDWSEATGATGYALQEDDNAGFNSPLNRYQGMDTRYDVTHQDVGTWFYRVRASNAAGNSPWSAAQAATVIVPPGPRQVYLPLVMRGFFYDPTEPNDTFEQAWGPLVSGQTYRGYFPYESDSNDYHYLGVPTAHGIEIWLTGIPAGNDYALYLYDAAHALVPGGYSDNLGSADEHIFLSSMPAGTYYVRVERVIGTSRTQPYALRVVFQ